MPRAVAGKVVIGFEHKFGWFRRLCPHCLSQTRERVRHKFPSGSNNPEIGLWVSEPQHFACHLTHCMYSFCQQSKELLTLSHEQRMTSGAKGETI